MTAELLVETSTLPLLLGGLLSPIQLGLIALFLCSSVLVFVAVSKEQSLGRSIGVSGGIFLISASMVYFMF